MSETKTQSDLDALDAYLLQLYLEAKSSSLAPDYYDYAIVRLEAEAERLTKATYSRQLLRANE